MYQGTTQILILEVPDVDMTDKTIRITFKTVNGKKITKVNKDVDIAGTQTAVRLTQGETMELAAGPVRVQVKYADPYGNVGITEMGYIDVDGVMDNELLTGGSDE